MVQDEIDATKLDDQRRWSWTSLHESYQSGYGSARFRYIVARLIDSPIAERFTVGEAFLFSYQDPDEKGPKPQKTIDELYSDAARSQQIPTWVARGLYFTTGAYWTRLDQVAHVVVSIGFPGDELFAKYCRGLDIIESHICQTRKEIPCILSLLELLEKNA